MRWIRSIIAPSNQDLKIVALSILGATIIWVLSALNKTYTTIIKCPVKLNYDKEGTIVVKKPPEYIEANVTGVGWDLLKQSISFGKDPLLLSVNNPVEIRQIAGNSITPLLRQHLSSLQLNSILTDSITFNIQPLKDKMLLAYLDKNSISMAQYHQIVSPISILPDSVLLKGPKSFVDTLSDTLFLKLPMNNIDEDVNTSVQANNFNKTLISVIPPEVQVAFEVSRFVDYRKVFNIELVNFPMDSSIYVVPPRVEADFKIQEEYVDNFPATDFMIIADYNNVDPKDSTVSLEIIESPTYVKDIILDTTVVKVIYARKKRHT